MEKQLASPHISPTSSVQRPLASNTAMRDKDKKKRWPEGRKCCKTDQWGPSRCWEALGNGETHRIRLRRSPESTQSTTAQGRGVNGPKRAEICQTSPKKSYQISHQSKKSDKNVRWREPPATAKKNKKSSKMREILEASKSGETENIAQKCRKLITSFFCAFYIWLS